jgi:hypothetical protein
LNDSQPGVDRLTLIAIAVVAYALANLVHEGLLALLALRARLGTSTATRYFLWLFMTVNLLQAAGYWLFSGLANIGDWAVVIGGFSPRGAFRVGLAALGASAYWGAILLSLRELATFLAPGASGWRHALPLTVVPYVAGGILYVAAGVLNPVGWRLVLVSAAAAAFGGTSALAWMAQLLRDEARFPRRAPTPSLPRSAAWIAAGTIVALLFVLVLGPGVRF